MINYTQTCPFCNKNTTVQAEADDIKKWMSGMPAQQAFPYLSADEREIIMTGICVDCWPDEED